MQIYLGSRLTVQDSALVDIGRESSFRIREQTHVQLLLGRREVVLSNNDCPGWETKVVRTLELGSSQHHTVEQNLELFESRMTWIAIADTVLGNGSEDFSILHVS